MGGFYEWLEHSHRRWGRIIRIGPNRLSTSDADLIRRLDSKKFGSPRSGCAENHLGKVLDDHIDRADQGVAEVDLAQIAERFSIQAFSNMAFGQNLAESDVRVISRTVSKGQLGFMVMTMFPWIRICIGDPSALLKLDQYVAFGKTLATVKKTATDRLAGTMYAPSMTTTSLKITHADIISGLQATDLNAEQIADNLNVQMIASSAVTAPAIAHLGGRFLLQPQTLHSREKVTPPKGYPEYKVPGGTLIGICLGAAMRDREVFGANPDEYEPSRWMTSQRLGETQPESLANRNNVLELNSGSGVSKCLGRKVALLELAIFVSKLTEYEWKPTKGPGEFGVIVRKGVLRIEKHCIVDSQVVTGKQPLSRSIHNSAFSTSSRQQHPNSASRDPSTRNTYTTLTKHKASEHCSGKMCWFERQYPNCPLCGGVGAPEILNLGCPFNQPLGECNFVYETPANITRPHPNCVELDRIANEVLGRTPPVQAGPAHIDARDGVGPYDTPLPSPALQTPAIPVSDGSLPAAWSSDSNNNPSPEMIIAIIRRTELQNMIPEFATALKDLETAVGPSNPHFTQVIEFVTQHITGASLAADIHVSMIQEAEFQIANNIGDRNTARWNIDWIIRGITNTSPGFESAVIWHRRYTDLIIHLRRLAGRLSPPRPAATDEMPPPLPVRRGASAGIDPADLDDHSDFLPPPEFYLPEDAFDSDDDVEFDPDEDEQFGGDDEEDMEWDDSHYP
ncbi:cytochrome P450 [Aureobasidium pullulans EXF-150]|uniref:Cytochrome P450 n=2 Tax=Aureobasidium pullulans TaxID=5580 RepID=A0A074X5A9_AURPU|nr:cytochrome P450 [Aureobasidium pullulans EXF-150]KEQ78964.1 cytochrome P450 [Aureobasidium pullulans EXF-150]